MKDVVGANRQLRPGATQDRATSGRLLVSALQQTLIQKARRPVGRLIETYPAHRIAVDLQRKPGGGLYDFVRGDHGRSILRGEV